LRRRRSRREAMTRGRPRPVWSGWTWGVSMEPSIAAPRIDRSSRRSMRATSAYSLRARRLRHVDLATRLAELPRLFCHSELRCLPDVLRDLHRAELRSTHRAEVGWPSFRAVSKAIIRREDLIALREWHW